MSLHLAVWQPLWLVGDIWNLSLPMVWFFSLLISNNRFRITLTIISVSAACILIFSWSEKRSNYNFILQVCLICEAALRDCSGCHQCGCPYKVLSFFHKHHVPCFPPTTLARSKKTRREVSIYRGIFFIFLFFWERTVDFIKTNLFLPMGASYIWMLPKLLPLLQMVDPLVFTEEGATFLSLLMGPVGDCCSRLISCIPTSHTHLLNYNKLPPHSQVCLGVSWCTVHVCFPPLWWALPA